MSKTSEKSSFKFDADQNLSDRQALSPSHQEQNCTSENRCEQCDTAARMGLSSSQGDAVLRDASRAIGKELSLPQVEAAAKIFSLLGDAGRLQLVLRCMDVPQTVGELAEACGMSQSLTSHHLRHLRAQRILASERQGRHIYYRLDDAHISNLVRDAFDHVTHK